MSTADDLKTHASQIFGSRWDVKDGLVVPEPSDLTLGNSARKLDRATILYADISGSTKLVDALYWEVAGEVYKTFLSCAARLIRDHGGSLTSYDGDRVMGVFVGDKQTTNAVKTGLKINWAVKNIVNPALKKQYPTLDYTVKHAVGIDSSEIRAARIGVRNGNDLVWIGRAANYAAKLTECRPDYPTWLTAQAYHQIKNGYAAEVWKQFKWTGMNDIAVYGSNYWIAF